MNNKHMKKKLNKTTGTKVKTWTEKRGSSSEASVTSNNTCIGYAFEVGDTYHALNLALHAACKKFGIPS